MTDSSAPPLPSPAAIRAAFDAQRTSSAGFAVPVSFIALCVVLALVLCGGAMLFGARWEYHTEVIAAVGVNNVASSRQGTDALRYSAALPTVAKLDSLGALGWELTTSYLEMETAWPNFGNDAYVNGLQPNVRPQDVVLIFRRRRLGRVRL